MGGYIHIDTLIDHIDWDNDIEKWTLRREPEDIPALDFVGVIANEDLSLDELGEIVNEALAKIYSKLRTDIGMHYPIGVISSLGEESYNVDVRFVEGESRNAGEYYDQVYCI